MIANNANNLCWKSIVHVPVTLCIDCVYNLIWNVVGVCDKRQPSNKHTVYRQTQLMAV